MVHYGFTDDQFVPLTEEEQGTCKTCSTASIVTAVCGIGMIVFSLYWLSGIFAGLMLAITGFVCQQRVQSKRMLLTGHNGCCCCCSSSESQIGGIKAGFIIGIVVGFLHLILTIWALTSGPLSAENVNNGRTRSWLRVMGIMDLIFTIIALIAGTVATFYFASKV
jgi:hypothetical protein